MDATVDNTLAPLIQKRWQGSQAIVVADQHTQALVPVWLAQASLPNVHTHVIPAGEGSKSLALAETLYRVLAQRAADRQTLLVALGGGVVGDLAGFVAATYNRGLPLLMVPTSLLAMVDSSVGGKVGINLPEGKNLVGAFHQPRLVWIDVRHLHSLPEREFRSGLAEVVKYGMILDADFFGWLETHQAAILAREPDVLLSLVRRCCELKAQVVEQDEFERTGIRAALNYGHTFAHAFESVAGYGTWTHGEAVAVGMDCAARLAARRGRISNEVVIRQAALLDALGLPRQVDRTWSVDALLQAMRTDKKALAGRLRFVLPTRLGEVRLVDDVPETEVRAVLAGG
jgi:3-dehydroquinate synthase